MTARLRRRHEGRPVGLAPRWKAGGLVGAVAAIAGWGPHTGTAALTHMISILIHEDSHQ